MTSEYAGWGVAIIGAIGTAIKLTYDYLKRKNDNATKVKLSENGKEERLKEDLLAQQRELLLKLDELESKLEHTEKQLEKALLAFDIILPIFQNMLKEKPEYKEVLDKALQHIGLKNQNATS